MKGSALSGWDSVKDAPYELMRLCLWQERTRGGEEGLRVNQRIACKVEGFVL